MIAVQEEGTIAILYGEDQAGEDWLHEHLPEDTQRWNITGWVVEHRYLAAIVDGARADGLTVHPRP